MKSDLQQTYAAQSCYWPERSLARSEVGRFHNYRKSMAKTHVTEHYNNGEHTRRRVTEREDGSRRDVEQIVHDTEIGELGATNTRVTETDKHGNSKTYTP